MSAVHFRFHRGMGVLACIALLVLAAASLRDVGRFDTADDTVSVIVQAATGAEDVPRRVIADVGGQVSRELAIIGGFAATVPVRAVGAIRQANGVVSVTPDARLALQSTDDGSAEDPGRPWLSLR